MSIIHNLSDMGVLLYLGQRNRLYNPKESPFVLYSSMSFTTSVLWTLFTSSSFFVKISKYIFELRIVDLVSETGSFFSYTSVHHPQRGKDPENVRGSQEGREVQMNPPYRVSSSTTQVNPYTRVGSFCHHLYLISQEIPLSLNRTLLTPHHLLPSLLKSLWSLRIQVSFLSTKWTCFPCGSGDEILLLFSRLRINGLPLYYGVSIVGTDP